MLSAARTDEVVRSDVLSALYGRHVDVFHAHGRVLVSVGDEHREDGCEAGRATTARTATTLRTARTDRS